MPYINIIDISFFQKDPHQYIVRLYKNNYYDSNDWYITYDLNAIGDFIRSYSSDDIRLHHRYSLTPNKLTINLGQWSLARGVSEGDIEYDPADWVINALDEIKSNIPDFIRDSLNHTLEKLLWLPIRDGYIIVVNFDIFDGPYAWSDTIERGVLVFERASPGIWRLSVH